MDVRILGVPMGLADQRGVDIDSSAIGYVGLTEQPEAIGASYADGGDIPIPRPEGRGPSAAGFDSGRSSTGRPERSVRTSGRPSGRQSPTARRRWSMEAVADYRDHPRSFELVDVDPVLGNRTAELAREPAAGAFGKRVC